MRQTHRRLCRQILANATGWRLVARRPIGCGRTGLQIPYDVMHLRPVLWPLAPCDKELRMVIPHIYEPGEFNIGVTFANTTAPVCITFVYSRIQTYTLLDILQCEAVCTPSCRVSSFSSNQIRRSNSGIAPSRSFIHFFKLSLLPSHHDQLLQQTPNRCLHQRPLPSPTCPFAYSPLLT